MIGSDEKLTKLVNHIIEDDAKLHAELKHEVLDIKRNRKEEIPLHEISDAYKYLCTWIIICEYQKREITNPAEVQKYLNDLCEQIVAHPDLNKSSCEECQANCTASGMRNSVKMLKILFVCAGNANRSPAFEAYFKEHYHDLVVKSSGIYYAYHTPLKEGLGWADAVFVMDLEQEMFIAGRYPAYLEKVHVIGVSDEYDRSTDELIDIIRYWELNYFQRFILSPKKTADHPALCNKRAGPVKGWVNHKRNNAGV